MWYSNTTESFHDDTFPNTVIPSDAISITDDVFANVVNGIAGGFTITTDGSGIPVVANVAAMPSIRVITSYAFLNRCTNTERATIVMASLAGMQASPPDPTLAIFLDDMGAATIVNLDGATINYALTALTELGILANGRMDELLVDGTYAESIYGPVSNS
jgi:hypothetical protein